MNPDNYDFDPCRECEDKSAHEPLCESCRNNRDAIAALQRGLRSANESLDRHVVCHNIVAAAMALVRS